MTTSVVLVEDWVLCGDGENLILLEDASDASLVHFLASTADSPGFGNTRRFGSHREATAALAAAAVEYLRSSWSVRHGREDLFAGIPAEATAFTDLPPVPRGLPRYFVLTGAPRHDDVERIRRYAKPRYTERVVILPVAMPGVVLQLLRREGFLTATRWDFND